MSKRVGVRVYPQVELPVEILVAKKTSKGAADYPRVVSPLGAQPRWYQIDKQTGWHATIRPLPTYNLDTDPDPKDWVAWVSKSRYETTVAAYKGQGTTLRAALFNAWEQATAKQNQLALKERVGFSNPGAIEQWIEEAPEDVTFTPFELHIPKPAEQCRLQVWYDEDYQYLDPDSEVSNRPQTYHDYNFYALSAKPAPQAPNMILRSAEVPVFSSYEEIQTGDRYLVVAFTQKRDYYSIAAHVSTPQGVFSSLEDAQLFASELEKLYCMPNSDLNEVGIYPLAFED